MGDYSVHIECRINFFFLLSDPRANSQCKNSDSTRCSKRLQHFQIDCLQFQNLLRWQPKVQTVKASNNSGELTTNSSSEMKITYSNSLEAQSHKRPQCSQLSYREKICITDDEDNYFLQLSPGPKDGRTGNKNVMQYMERYRDMPLSFWPLLYLLLYFPLYLMYDSFCYCSKGTSFGKFFFIF